MWTTCGQLGASTAATVKVLIAAAGLLLAALVMFVVIAWLRRRMQRELAGGSRPREAFSIESLERMRRQGRLSEEEFRRLRRGILGLSAERREKESSPSSTPPNGDDVNDGNEDSPPGNREGRQ